MNRQTIRARVTFQDLEGGFWGLVSAAGDRYVPVESLAEDFREDGLEVEATIEPVHVLGTTMWGQHVNILDISPCS
ncbi:MAG: hypothetical protein HKN17_01195 [Rhodothermales bacterium]|nr:hypothetical protein [Rhodothermales bacterium]